MFLNAATLGNWKTNVTWAINGATLENEKANVRRVVNS